MVTPGPICILVVSRSETGRHALSGTLQQAGFEVREAATAAEALHLALEKPALILIEFAPSDMSGLELCYRMKTEPTTALIPLLPFFSDHAGGGDQGEAGSTFPATPVQAMALRAAVETLIRLRLAENRFDGFLESAPDAVVIADQQGTIVRINAQTENLFGYGSGELLGQSVEMLMPERFQSKHVEHRAGYNANPGTRPMGTDLQLYGLRKNGDEFPADISLGPLPHEGGFLIASVIRDVTAHRQLQDALRPGNRKLEAAYQTLDRQFRIIGEIQRSLLPSRMPANQAMDLAVYYRPSERASGDYYDFFPLPDGQLGIFLGDVSGHGTPAAVVMAITHCIAHTRPGLPKPPGAVLEYLNFHLANTYTNRIEGFVTAFYGIYNPADRTLTYACAGHPSPRLKRLDGTLVPLGGVNNLPLGLDHDQRYGECTQQLGPGDQIIFYTDGVTDAFNRQEEWFGLERLNHVLEKCALQGAALLDALVGELEAFTKGHPADDDRTLIVARIA